LVLGKGGRGGGGGGVVEGGSFMKKMQEFVGSSCKRGDNVFIWSHIFRNVYQVLL